MGRVQYHAERAVMRGEAGSVMFSIILISINIYRFCVCLNSECIEERKI